MPKSKALARGAGRAQSSPLNLFEYERLAARRLGKMAYDYFQGGACDEITLERNCNSWRQIELSPKVLVGGTGEDTGTYLLGQAVGLPVFVSPTALHGLAHQAGEKATARGVGKGGTILTLSAMSNASLEDVAALRCGPLWFQILLFKDRELTKSFVRRAEEAGCKALVLAVDSAVGGRRERDLANQFRLPKALGLGNFEGLEKVLRSGKGRPSLAAIHTSLVDGRATWKDVAWLRTLTRLPLVIKGVMRPEDARKAVEIGAQAVLVSNHGGRQLDTCQPTSEVLGRVVEAVSGKAEVLVDGGIRRGTDILKAIALGATAVGIGRPILWGLAADGENGVARVLGLLKDELGTAMALAGCHSVREISKEILAVQWAPERR